MREFELINWIRKQGRFDPAIVEVGPGDDCAVLRVGGEKLLVTADQVLDGVHLTVARDGARAAGRKAAARNLSDIAAMAGEPLAMIVTVALPAGFTQADGRELYIGLCEAGEPFDCPVVGGDIASWGNIAKASTPGGSLQVSVTVLGRCAGVGPILRSGAKPGDAVCVTGALGGAWRGQRHLSFTPRVREARLLAQSCPIHAMIDISDGLAGDLGHLARESGLAARLDAAAIPIHPDAAALADPLAAALHDGEDYELLFAITADCVEHLLAQQPLGVKITRIGTMLEGAGLTIERNGDVQPLEPRGWEHGT